MDGKIWQNNQKPYNRLSVQQKIQGFSRNQLVNPNQSKRWVDFAKVFSEMRITDNDIEDMSFETFMKLKEIMSGSLTSLSRSTQDQRRILQNLQNQHQKLIEEEKKLQKIQEQNVEKEKNINKYLQKLKVQKDKLNDSQQNMSFDESQIVGYDN